MGREETVHTYIIKHHSAIKKNGTESFAVTLIQLEIIILSEVSQKEKDKYHMISLTWESKIWHK